jgi:multisubunit Na+/H+ antiporter MnhB subunit
VSAWADRTASAGAGILAFAAAAAVLRASLSPPPRPGGLTAPLKEITAAHPVGNAVTVVLLDVRGYDTFLELGVLLAAALGAYTLSGAERLPRATPPSRVLRALVALLLPLVLVTGVYLLAMGTRAPGGAFQAGAVLAAGAILARLSGVLPGEPPGGLGGRLLLILGFAVFLAVGVMGPLAAAPLFRYPAGWTGPLILLVETMATVSIAATLFALVAWTDPGDDR